MRLRDLIDLLAEAKPTKPLSPEQARKRADRIRAAQDRVTDVQRTNAVKLDAARRKLNNL